MLPKNRPPTTRARSCLRVPQATRHDTGGAVRKTGDPDPASKLDHQRQAGRDSRDGCSPLSFFSRPRLKFWMNLQTKYDLWFAERDLSNR